jgi:hypothetical protein
VGSQADIYYCGDDMKARSSFMAGLMGDMGSKFENIVRFCFVDDDKDGRFDHYFLAGAKDPLFLKEQPVGPLPYRVEHLVQENAADEIRLKYRKFDTTTSKISLELEITRNGAALPFEYIITPTHTGRNEQYYRMASNPAKVPYPVVFEDVLGADIIIDRCNPTERRNFSCSAISPLAVQALQPERAIHFHLHLIAPPRCACAMRLWNWSTPPRTSGMSDTEQDAAKAAWDAAHVRAWLESRMAAAAKSRSPTARAAIIAMTTIKRRQAMSAAGAAQLTVEEQDHFVAFLTAQLAKDDYLLAGVNDDRRFEREVRACLRKLIKKAKANDGFANLAFQ